MSEEKNTTRTERGARILEELKAKAVSSDTASKAEVKEEKPEPPTREARPARGRTARRGASRRGSSRRQRRGEKERDATQESKAPLLSAIAGIAIIGGGAIWWFAFRGNTPEDTEAKLPEAITETAPEPKLPIVEVQAPAPPPEIEEQPAVEVIEESSLPPEEPSQPPPSAGFTAPNPGETIEYKGITELAILDLTLVPSLPKWGGSSDEDWEGIKEDVVLFAANEGVHSSRAGDRLVDIGRGAFPGIVNGMLQGSWVTKEDNRFQLALNDLLTKMSGKGANFGWKSTEALDSGSAEFLEAALFNKKVAAQWHWLWIRRFAEDDAQWEGFTAKKGAQKSTEPGASPGPSRSTAPPVDDFDD